MQQNKRTTKNYRHICIKHIHVIIAISYVIICGWLLYANSEGQAGIIVCPSKLLYHIPCPGCGITRATLRFLHFDIKGALLMNPNVIFSITFLFICPIILLIDWNGKKDIFSRLYNNIELLFHKKVIWIPFLIIEILIWFHNIIENL